MQFIKFEGSADYLIEVKGRLLENLPLFLDDAEIVDLSNNEIIKTAIRVIVKDQAHLSGILTYLYDKHHTIIKVEHVPNSESRLETVIKSEI